MMRCGWIRTGRRRRSCSDGRTRSAGDRRQAIGAWRAAAAIDPTMVPAHLALAEAYLQMSERALAVQALRAGLLSLPDSPELLAKLAWIESGK